jgi:hypothetical protein
MNEGDVPGAESGNGEGVARNGDDGGNVMMVKCGDDGWSVMMVKCGDDVGRGGWGVGRCAMVHGSRNAQ